MVSARSCLEPLPPARPTGAGGSAPGSGAPWRVAGYHPEGMVREELRGGGVKFTPVVDLSAADPPSSDLAADRPRDRDLPPRDRDLPEDLAGEIGAPPSPRRGAPPPPPPPAAPPAAPRSAGMWSHLFKREEPRAAGPNHNP